MTVWDQNGMREVIYYERSHLQLDQMPCHILYSVDYAHPSGAYREISALCAFFYGTFADGYADHFLCIHSLYKTGYTLGISAASADETDIVDFLIVIYFKFNMAGADTFCFIRHDMFPPV